MVRWVKRLERNLEALVSLCSELDTPAVPTAGVSPPTFAVHRTAQPAAFLDIEHPINRFSVVFGAGATMGGKIINGIF
jgi:hypothetical protein